MSDSDNSGNEIESTLSASQKGKIVEQLVGATCVLQSDGRLRISIPLVDDEGVDLIVSDRSTDNVLLLQIKSRFTLHNGSYRTDVRRVALHANKNRYLLFVYYDRENANLGKTMWLVPSLKFKELLSGQRPGRGTYVFQSRFNSSNDMWAPYKINAEELGRTLLKHLNTAVDLRTETERRF
jgi:hypothetical protein